MTEALKQWVCAQRVHSTLGQHDYADSPMAAEFWIRAFCEEISKRHESEQDRQERTIDVGCRNNSIECHYRAFAELKRELVGK